MALGHLWVPKTLSQFQNEAKCTTLLVKMSFIYRRMRNHLTQNFQIKGWALNLVLIQRPGGTRKCRAYMSAFGRLVVVCRKSAYEKRALTNGYFGHVGVSYDFFRLGAAVAVGLVSTYQIHRARPVQSRCWTDGARIALLGVMHLLRCACNLRVNSVVYKVAKFM